ncbi:hypothetical protein SAMN05421854_1194 [Amycolatopsis rubida]|uniref:Uncharacterized protein n=1 Tax=Amycolatopsis rubida TaxID=112413 RepID=A0A1I6AH06_9PSEU|nr:hypothetical protein SAMN05421854_1194 [Amycolatopsis rubida]
MRRPSGTVAALLRLRWLSGFPYRTARSPPSSRPGRGWVEHGICGTATALSGLVVSIPARGRYAPRSWCYLFLPAPARMTYTLGSSQERPGSAGSFSSGCHRVVQVSPGDMRSNFPNSSRTAADTVARCFPFRQSARPALRFFPASPTRQGWRRQDVGNRCAGERGGAHMPRSQVALRRALLRRISGGVSTRPSTFRQARSPSESAAAPRRGPRLDHDGIPRYALGGEQILPDFAEWTAERNEARGLGRNSALLRSASR